MVARKRNFDRINKSKAGSIFIQRALRRTLQVEVRHIGGSGLTGSWFSCPDLCRFAKGNAVSRENVQTTP